MPRWGNLNDENRRARAGRQSGAHRGDAHIGSVLPPDDNPAARQGKVADGHRQQAPSTADDVVPVGLVRDEHAACCRSGMRARRPRSGTRDLFSEQCP
jgi:hypothetical protein